MEREQAAFLALAGLVAVAGVGMFVLGGDSGPTPTPAQPSATPTGEPAPTASPTTGDADTPQPTATLTPIENRTQRYRFDGAAVNRTHFYRLAAVGNYTSRSNLTVDGPDVTRHVNVSYVMDLQDDREYSVQVFTYEFSNAQDRRYPVVSTYTEGNTTWQRRQERDGENATVEKDSAPYRGEVEPVNTTLALDVGDIAAGVIDRSAWQLVGNATRGGVELYRLQASGRHLNATVPGAVENGSATFVIGGDGIVRYVHYDFVAVEGDERTRYVYESFYGRLGEAFVPRPSWAE